MSKLPEPPLRVLAIVREWWREGQSEPVVNANATPEWVLVVNGSSLLKIPRFDGITRPESVMLLIHPSNDPEAIEFITESQKT